MEDIYITKYYNKEMYMVGALDCFGVPHTPDNIKHKSYLDLLADYFNDLGIHVNYVNLHSLGCNKTYQLKDILLKDYLKKDYYQENKRMSLKAIQRKDIFPFPVHEKFLDDYYDNPTNPNLKITSHLCGTKNPIFFYSCGQMDFHKLVNMRSGDIKKILPEVTLNLNKNLSQTLDNVEDVIKFIISINSTVEIYMFGVYPMFTSKIKRDLLAPIYALVNIEIKDRFKSYHNVHFVDVLGNINKIANDDCHPDFSGQQYMKQKVLNKMYSKKYR